MGVGKRIHGTVLAYGKSTTVKGIPKVIKSEKYFLKVLWSFAVLLGGSFAAFQVVTLFTRYLSYGSVTKVEIKNEEPEFPDVTICNLNPLSSAIDTWPMEIYTYNVDNIVYKAKAEMSHVYNKMYNDNNITSSETDEIYQSLTGISGYLQNIPLNESILSNYFERFLTECIFYDWEGSTLENVLCNLKNIRVLFHPGYFYCFTIQVPEQLKHKVRGLSVITFLDASEQGIRPSFSMHAGTSKSNGVRVKLHPRNTLPTLYNGHSLGPGLESTITISPIRIEKLPEPYGECTTKEFLEYEDSKEPEEGKTLLKYTRASCSSFCKHKIIIRECGCIDPVYGYSSRHTTGENSSISFCGDMKIDLPYNETRRGEPNSTEIIDIMYSTNSITGAQLSQYWDNELCSIRARDSFDSECNCKDSCSMTYYDMSIAQAEWPMIEYQLAFYEKYIMLAPYAAEFGEYGHIQYEWTNNMSYLMPDVTAALREETKLRENFAQVNILFEDPKIQVSTEQPAMTWDTILSYLGGTLNLWIGISFVTVIEIIELFYNLLSVCCSSRQTLVTPI